jgi:hypothetical protein
VIPAPTSRPKYHSSLWYLAGGLRPLPAGRYRNTHSPAGRYCDAHTHQLGLGTLTPHEPDWLLVYCEAQARKTVLWPEAKFIFVWPYVVHMSIRSISIWKFHMDFPYPYSLWIESLSGKEGNMMCSIKLLLVYAMRLGALKGPIQSILNVAAARLDRMVQ